MSKGGRPTAQTKSVYELFSGKVFRVPDYQRNYSWDEKNWEDFWNDVKEGISTETDHYWGTITLEGTDEELYCEKKDIPFEICEIVDGQQRITTIFLFLLALSRKGKPAFMENFIKCEDIYRLRLGKLNDQFLKDLIDGEDVEPDIKTNRLLSGALDYFADQIGAFGDLDSISRYLQQDTLALEFTVQDSTLAIKAFESLNDRGKDLTLLDKTKSLLMFYSLRYLNDKFSTMVNDVFGNVFTNFDFIKEGGEKASIDYIRGKRFTEDELLRFFYHYFSWYAIDKYSLDIDYDYDTTAGDVFDYFLKGACIQLKETPSEFEGFADEFLSSLDDFASSFREVTAKAETDSEYAKLFKFLGLNTRVYPLIMSIESEGITSTELLDIIETLDLRVYKVRGTDPRADLYKDTITEIKNGFDADDIYSGVRNFIDYIMWDDEFRSRLSGAIYGNRAVKYILWNLEKNRNDQFDESDYSLFKNLQVEHIFPQEPTFRFPTKGFRNDEDYIDHRDNFGNLCLLEEDLNKKAGNLPPKKKAKIYQQSKAPITRELGFHIENKGIDKADIERRTKDIIDFCVNRWRYS